MHIFLLNPFDYFKGLIKTPLGIFTFDGCDCKTCRNTNNGKPVSAGWGIALLFFGVSFFK